MILEIPDDSLQSVLQGLRKNSVKASRYVADRIELQIHENQATEYALLHMDIAEITTLIDEISPGSNRFRLLSALQSIKERTQ